MDVSRSVKNKRVKRRKNRAFKGKKERLREEIKTLKSAKEECMKRNSELELQYKHLKRYFKAKASELGTAVFFFIGVLYKVN